MFCLFFFPHDHNDELLLFVDDDYCVYVVELQELNLYLEFLFELIVARGPAVGLNISLTRYDLFHGHLFLAKDTGRLGIL